MMSRLYYNINWDKTYVSSCFWYWSRMYFKCDCPIFLFRLCHLIFSLCHHHSTYTVKPWCRKPYFVSTVSSTWAIQETRKEWSWRSLWWRHCFRLRVVEVWPFTQANPRQRLSDGIHKYLADRFPLGRRSFKRQRIPTPVNVKTLTLWRTHSHPVLLVLHQLSKRSNPYHWSTPRARQLVWAIYFNPTMPRLSFSCVI